jgi:hypothetical protein
VGNVVSYKYIHMVHLWITRRDDYQKSIQ